MNAQSIPVVAMASISLYVGFYHLLIYFRRRQHREDLTFALLCLVTSLYDVFCIGLYNSSTVAEGVQWQRAQLIALALFTTAFLWFVSDYTHQKPGLVLYAFSAFYLLAILIQLVDRSNLTLVVDSRSVKEVLLPLGIKITYQEATLGPFTAVQSLIGLAASTYIAVSGIRFYKRGYKREAVPLLLAMGFMYAAAFNDTAVSNGLYQFVYIIEYGYMAMILLMAYSLSNTVVEAAMAKEAWRASEERFRTLVETTSDWVWETDPDSVYTYVSPKARELLGYEPQEIIGKTPFDLMPPAEANRISAIFHEIANVPKPIEGLENVIRRKDGQLVVLETSGVPFFDANGKLMGYRGIDRDITERKQTEQILQLRLRLMEFAATHSLEELLQKTLDEVGELTNSPIGFYHFVEADQRTLSLQAWSTRTLNEFCQAGGKGLHYPIDQAGVWTDCVRERRPVIHNDYSSLPHRKGLPEGHAPVTRELVVPILRGDRTVAILGIGNKRRLTPKKILR
jgi:PAS domain S-box-containing protein